ncbi:Dbl homology domain-containing protein [Martensiomyces pterosporus]|nr:Dbl homology domain-containing protein [Martensiomyces pterosporus]
MPRIAPLNAKLYKGMLDSLGSLATLIEPGKNGQSANGTEGAAKDEEDDRGSDEETQDAAQWSEDNILEHLQSVCIGEVVAKHLKSFTEQYSMYKNDHINAKIYLDYIKEECSKWGSRNSTQRELYQGVLEAIWRAEKDPRARRLGIRDFLVMPMQRLTKYPLLLQALLKYTPEEHPDHRPIFIALGVALKVTREVDDA